MIYEIDQHGILNHILRLTVLIRNLFLYFPCFTERLCFFVGRDLRNAPIPSRCVVWDGLHNSFKRLNFTDALYLQYEFLSG